MNDFVKHEPNRNNPLQFVWVFKTSDGQTYYIKFVFAENNQKVVFISFHLDY
ncbi:type II toxin-antitoxin system MqsR family toxin [Limosilactobacillus albertensis]|nr:type II toxin-antitoxin system MqsR family toxin [Limosilactobacillus albertensis]MCD7127941.1 type II toxin-antitoxin system MqsR family toxin [Limosilactobacillus albertensis]